MNTSNDAQNAWKSQVIGQVYKVGLGYMHHIRVDLSIQVTSLTCDVSTTLEEMDIVPTGTSSMPVISYV